MADTRQRVRTLVHVLRYIIITQHSPRGADLHITQPLLGSGFDPRLLRYTPTGVHGREETPPVLLYKTIRSIRAEVDRQQVPAAVFVVQTGERRSSALLRGGVARFLGGTLGGQSDRGRRADGVVKRLRRDAVAVEPPPLGADHRLEVMSAPSMVIRQGGVKHQVQYRSRAGEQSAARHTYLYRTEILVFLELIARISGERSRTIRMPYQALDELHIQISASIQ